MIVIGGDVPRPMPQHTRAIDSANVDNHATQRCSQEIEHSARAVKKTRQALGLAQKAPCTQRGDGRKRPLREAYFKGRRKPDTLAYSVMAWEQLQIWNIAKGSNPRTQTMKMHGFGRRPAQALLPACSLPNGYFFAAIAQNASQCGLSSRGPLGRCNADVDAVDALPTFAQMFNHGRGQGRHSARPTNAASSCRNKSAIQCLREVADEPPSIRQIDVMRSGLCAGQGHAVPLMLKGACSMNDKVHTMAAQNVG